MWHSRGASSRPTWTGFVKNQIPEGRRRCTRLGGSTSRRVVVPERRRRCHCLKLRRRRISTPQGSSTVCQCLQISSSYATSKLVDRLRRQQTGGRNVERPRGCGASGVVVFAAKRTVAASAANASVKSVPWQRLGRLEANGSGGGGGGGSGGARARAKRIGLPGVGVTTVATYGRSPMGLGWPRRPKPQSTTCAAPPPPPATRRAVVWEPRRPSRLSPRRACDASRPVAALRPPLAHPHH